jgi:hypothetical protein
MAAAWSQIRGSPTYLPPAPGRPGPGSDSRYRAGSQPGADQRVGVEQPELAAELAVIVHGGSLAR